MYPFPVMDPVRFLDEIRMLPIKRTSGLQQQAPCCCLSLVWRLYCLCLDGHDGGGCDSECSNRMKVLMQFVSHYMSTLHKMALSVRELEQCSIYRLSMIDSDDVMMGGFLVSSPEIRIFSSNEFVRTVHHTRSRTRTVPYRNLPLLIQNYH